MRCGLDYEVIGKQHSWVYVLREGIKHLILDGIFGSYVAGQKNYKEKW